MSSKTNRAVVEGLEDKLDGNTWISDLTRIAREYALSLPDVRSIVADLTWLARERGAPYPDLPPAGDIDGDTTLDRLVQVYAYCHRLRYDFRYAQLWRDSRRWRELWEGDPPSDPLVAALAAFGALGSGASYLEQGRALVGAAVDHPEADARTRHVALMALQVAPDFPGRYEFMLQISSEMIDKGEVDPNVHFRRAWAMRGLGRYEEALVAVDRAIDMLPPASNAVHQDYIRERELIISSRQTEKRMEAMASSMIATLTTEVNRAQADAQREIQSAQEQLRSEVGERLNEARSLVSEGLFRIIEILGLFIAILGFVIGSGFIFLDSQAVNQRIYAMIVVLVGSVAFFLLLRLVASLGRRR